MCDDVCRGADLAPLVRPELGWLWQAVAVTADRRRDPDLTAGKRMEVVLPESAAERAAVAGLTQGRRARQRVHVDLPWLTRLVRTHGDALTPGAVAAHAVGRSLAAGTRILAARRHRREVIRAALVAACHDVPELYDQGESLYEALRRTGWVARNDGDAELAARLIVTAVRVVRTIVGLPQGERRDRRVLVPGEPHALDEGTPLAGATLCLLTALGLISADPGTAARALWDQVGVDFDDLMGGLATLGFYPGGWELPPSAICTLPPRELSRVAWPAPPGGDGSVFVTENPSVLAAAADLVEQESGIGPVRLVCTLGTPSALEIAALARAAVAGWRVAVRADFDPAGIRHVTALLAGIPGATPWRMSLRDLERSVPVASSPGPIPPTPWDESVGRAMLDGGCIAFEEALLPELLDDLRQGEPG